MANKIQNQVNNQVATTNNGEAKTMQMYIKKFEGEIKKALPSVITPERFTRMVLSAISTNPKLASCTPNSFLGAMMSAAQLGLEPNTPLGQAYILPYQNKGTLEAQFQIGYKGLIDLAYRSGEVELVQAHIVYENDTFECEFGLDAKLRHVPADSDRDNAVKVYAMFKTKSGGYGFDVMSMDDIRKHAQKYSKAYSSSYSPWTTSFEEMAKKTVLKRCLKYAPLKSDFVRAVVQDGGIKNELSEDMYDVPNVIVDDADYTVVEDNTVVDTNTGEVVEG
jgi:recombination protein RecT